MREQNSFSHHAVRTERQSGGVSIYCSEKLSTKKIQQLSYVNSDVEVCTVQITIDQENLYDWNLSPPFGNY